MSGTKKDVGPEVRPDRHMWLSLGNSVLAGHLRKQANPHYRRETLSETGPSSATTNTIS